MRKIISILIAYVFVFSTLIYGSAIIEANSGTVAQIDFTEVDYENVVMSTWKQVSGDNDMTTSWRPTIKNIGTVPVQLKVQQDDMGFAMTNGIWNVEYKARLGINGQMVQYEPEVETQIPGILGVGEEKSLNFLIHVLKGYPLPGGAPHTGTMTLTAVQTEAPYDEESFTINLIATVVGAGGPGGGGGEPPIIKCKWEYDLDVVLEDPGPDPPCEYCSDLQHDAYPCEPGLQVKPRHGNSVTVGYYAIVTDPEGVGHIDRVFADVWHPNGEYKYQLELKPVGIVEGQQYDKSIAINEWYHVLNYHIDLITINEDWALSLPPDMLPFEEILFELEQEEAYLFYGEREISYCQPGGWYSVGIIAHDKHQMWCSYLYNPLWYVPTPAIQIDFVDIDYGNVVPSVPRIADGDFNMATSTKPTIRNVGNVPVKLTVEQDDMGFGWTGENWNVEYKARLLNPSGFSDFYHPEEEIQIPGYLSMCSTEKLDFLINVLQGSSVGNPYEGELYITASIYGDPEDWISPMEFDPAPAWVENPLMSYSPPTEMGPLGEDAAYIVDTLANVVDGGSGGEDAPIIKCKWEYDLDVLLEDPGPDPPCQYCPDLNHDAYPCEPGLQVKPILGDSVRVGYYAIVTDPNSPVQIDRVFADVWHPDKSFKYEIELFPVGFDGGSYDKYIALDAWDHVLNYHANLITINEEWANTLPPEFTPFDDITLELEEELAYLFYGEGDISYCQPAGWYYAGIIAVDTLQMWSPYLYNHFWYVPTPAIQKDFGLVDYGNVVMCTPNVCDGDDDMETSLMPTIKNVGNVPVDIYVEQDDMGFDTRIVGGVEEWNVEFQARMNENGEYTTWYEPEQTVRIPGYLGMCVEDKLDFLIHVILGHSSGNPYEGELDITASIHGDPVDWISPMGGNPAPAWIEDPLLSYNPDPELGPFSEEAYYVADTEANVVSGGGGPGDDAPIIKCKWEYDNDHDHDVSTEVGLQVAAVPGGDVTVGYYAIVTDPQGLLHTKGVLADVWYPDGEHKYQIELFPIGYDGDIFNYDKSFAIDAWNYVKTYHEDLITWNEEWVSGLPPEITPEDDVDNELDEVFAFVYYGEATINYQDPMGDYTVGVNAYDNLQIWSDYLFNEFSYIPTLAVQIDFSAVDYGNIVNNQWSYAGGDENMGTPQKPTIRNIGNVPVELKVEQDDMDFLYRIVNGDEEWNVEYKARLGLDGMFTDPYNPEDKIQIPGILDVGETKRLDFLISVIGGYPDVGYSGTITLTATQTVSPYHEVYYTIDTEAYVVEAGGGGGGSNDPPIIKCKWEYDLDHDHDALPNNEGLQVRTIPDENVKVGYYAILTDPQGVQVIDRVFAYEWYPNGAFKYMVELFPVGLTGAGYDKTEAMNIWNHVEDNHLDLVTFNEDWVLGLEPPFLDPYDDVDNELEQEEAYVFFGWAYMSHLDPPGDYTVGVRSYDYFGTWCDYLYNKFEYIPPNQAPTADANGPYTANEGSEITFDASGSTDPEEDELQYRWDFDNDGTWDTELTTDPYAYHTWYDDHTGYVTMKVTDGEFVDFTTADVEVYNVAPTIDTFGPFTTIENDTIDYDAVIIDPGIYDTFTYEWDFDDDGTYETMGEDPYFKYNDDYSGLIWLKVTDDDGGFNIASTTITVNNYDPEILDISIVDSNQAPQKLVEAQFNIQPSNSGATVTGTFYEDNVPLYYDGSLVTINETGTIARFYHDETKNYIANYTVDLDNPVISCWIDFYLVVNGDIDPTTKESTKIEQFKRKDGTHQERDVNVTNDLNDISSPPGLLIYTFSTNVLDNGSDDLTVEWDFGDSTSDTATYYNNGATDDTYPSSYTGTAPFTVEHIIAKEYSSQGTYTVTLTITDDDGGVIVNTSDLVVSKN